MNRLSLFHQRIALSIRLRFAGVVVTLIPGTVVRTLLNGQQNKLVQTWFSGDATRIQAKRALTYCIKGMGLFKTPAPPAGHCP